MKVTGYRSLLTAHDWGRPIGDVNGVVQSGITEVPVLMLETDVGLTGVGLGAHGDIAAMYPAIDGEDPRAVAGLYDGMLRHAFKSGHAGALFGTIGVLDMALWDLKAKAADEPLWRLLGAKDHVVGGYASGLDAGLDDEGLDRLYRRFAERGFTAAKLKGGRSVADDLHRFDVVEDALTRTGAPAPVFMLDANESWNRKQAVRYLSHLERRRDLAWIEEPVRRWDADGLEAVSRAVHAAVATGENLTGIEQFRPLVAHGAVDIVQTGSCWGVTHFLRVSALAAAFDLPVSPVAYNGNPLAAAAAAVPHCIGVEVQDLAFPHGIEVDQTFENGQIVLGDTPGSGIRVDETALVDPQSLWSSDAGPHIRPRDAGLRLRIDAPR